MGGGTGSSLRALLGVGEFGGAEIAANPGTVVSLRIHSAQN